MALQGLILATSFGQNNPAALNENDRSKILRPYKPVTPSEKLIAFADIGNCMVGWDAFVEDNLAVLRETSPSARPDDFNGWISNLHGFTKFVGARLEDISDVTQVEQWRASLAGIVDKLSLTETDGILAVRTRFEEVMAAS